MHASRPVYRITCGAVLVSAICLAACQREPARPKAVDGLSFTKLKARHDERLQKYRRDLQSPGLDEATLVKIHEQFSAYWLPAIDEMLQVAEAQPSTPIGLDAATWVLGKCDSGYAPHVQAAELILDHQPHPESLPGPLYPHLDGYHPVYERLLRLGANANPAREAKAHATFALAELLSTRAAYRNAMDATPQFDQERIKRGGAAQDAYLKSLDPAGDRAEARQLYELVERDYADVAYRDRTLGEVAHERLLPFTQGFSEVGTQAPDIDARDLDGNRLTLESLRGKVVVVSFWASWCGACLERIPEENQLIEEFAESDFVFMGINGDQTLEEARRAAKTNAIGFASWWDDPDAEETIVHRWGVTAWPTTSVIDANGTIRFKDLFGDDLRRAIRELLEADGSAKNCEQSR